MTVVIDAPGGDNQAGEWQRQFAFEGVGTPGTIESEPFDFHDAAEVAGGRIANFYWRGKVRENIRTVIGILDTQSMPVRFYLSG